MAASIVSSHLFALFFGLLGNFVSFLVFLSPTPTFYRIYKEKSARGFDPLPYSVALFSCMLTGYYGVVKEANGTLIISINAIGIGIESLYLGMYLLFAPSRERVNAIKLILSFNVGFMGLIVLLTALVTHGAQREKIVGWICAACSICVFASPLCAMKSVIKTKSVEFVPIWLSFSLTLCAVTWFCYGFLIRDFYVALPNVLGLLLGVTQMSLYFIYKNAEPTGDEKEAAGDLPISTDPVKVSELAVVAVKVEKKEGSSPAGAGQVSASPVAPPEVECVV